ncbi:MAG: hypothetical protein KatS3mg068_2726 [Candidatus Sericytochromatia bacterium]|nr:MAG: hypothetical protein KatS3mg068_2726 [Candidatus Sericytochromatia bacterium]
MKGKIIIVLLMFILITSTWGRAARTTYPVVFAHGMGGFDDILGYDYWGDDYGTFVGDPCDKFLEFACNWYIDKKQKAIATTVTPFQNSEYRGWQLANQVESYMAATGSSHINMIGHSQGGLDIRKAAKELYARKGYRVVKVLISISSPHRGSPVAKFVLENYTLEKILSALFNVFGNIIYGSGNDAIESLKQLMYNDYDPKDGKLTGAKQFNEKNPISPLYAERYASLMTHQQGLSLNPILLLVKAFYDIDGNGYCLDDCDNDGAAGRGNGNKTDTDDDGLVGINSQQMGYRLIYKVKCCGIMDIINTYYNTGYVFDINHPSEQQMISKEAIINQDHIDVIGIPPDTFDEMEFYAAIIDYIAYYD